MEASGPPNLPNCPARDALQDDNSFTLISKKSVGRSHTGSETKHYYTDSPLTHRKAADAWERHLRVCDGTS